jgi:hypothetical protein
MADDGRVGFEPVGEYHLHPLGAEHDVEIGQDDAFVDYDDTCADAFLDVLAAGFVGFHSTHPNDGRSNDLVRLSRRRRKRMSLERVQHRRLDIFLGDGPRRRVHPGVRKHHEQREQTGGSDP